MCRQSRAFARAAVSVVLLLSSGSVAAASAAEVGVHVEVRGPDGLAFADSVYISAVPAEQRPGRPLREIVSVVPAADFTVPPGVYGVMVAVRGYALEYRDAHFMQARNSLTVELRRAPVLNGTVADSDGNRIAGATVEYAPAAGAVAVSDLPPAAVQFLASSLRTTSDQNGAWHLPALRLPLIAEASGHAPAWAMINPDLPARPLDLLLSKGASLHLALDRSDPAAVVSVATVGVKDAKWHVPERFQSRVWGREALAPSLEWLALPPGRYRILASYPEPERVAQPVEIAQVTLAEGESGSARAVLPPTPPKVSSLVRFLLPPRTEVGDLRAFVRGSNELRSAHWAVVEALAGKVVYVDAAGGPADVFLMTSTELFSAPPDAPAAMPVAPVRIPRGEGRLRLVPAKGLTLPAFATVTYGTCANREQLKLPVSVARDGVVVLPLLVPCKVFALAFKALAALGVPASVAAGEQKWLGDFAVSAASTAEVHATFAHAPAAGAHLRALVTNDREKIVLAEVDANEHGVGVLDGLPPGEVTVEARFAKSQQAGSATVMIDPGKSAVVDPLEIPEPASIVVDADFDLQFRADYPSATLKGIVLEREGNKRPKETRSVDLRDGKHQASFEDVTPGRWHVMTWVSVEDMTQPVEVEAVDVGPGDQKHVDASVKPLVFKGQVLSGGHGIAADLGVGDPPGPNSGRRDLHSTSDGRFKVILPKSGYYRVTVRRNGQPEPVDVGDILFDASSPTVQIELPDGTLTVHVRRGDEAATDAAVVITTHGDSPDGVTRITRRGGTDANGSVSFENLQPGTWTIDAREAHGNRSGGKAVTIASASAAEATVELTDPHLFKGVVLDASGSFASGASVDCIYVGAGGMLNMAHADANDGGEFSISMAEPLPERVECGVSTAGGAIGAFINAPGDSVEFALPQAAGSMTIIDWGEKVIPDHFWLAAADGRVFDLSWAAKKFGKLWAPLAIARLPAGQWNVVRVDSGAALAAIVNGRVQGLPVAAEVRVAAGAAANVRIQNVKPK